MSLTHSFDYEYFPRIDLIIHALASGLTGETEAIIDTGAEFSIFDMGLAQALEIDFEGSSTVHMEPIGGSVFEARTATVRLSLLLMPELTIETTILLAPNVAPTPGNLIGLDILEHFDIAISHSQRTGLIGRSE